MFRFFSEFWFGIENMFPHKQTRHKKIIVRSPFEIENTEKSTASGRDLYFSGDGSRHLLGCCDVTRGVRKRGRGEQ